MIVKELKKELEKYPDDAFIDFEVDYDRSVRVAVYKLKPGSSIIDKELGELYNEQVS